MAARISAVGATIEVVDKTGKAWNTGHTILRAFKDAKAAYHARRAEILAERAMARAKDAANLVVLEKEARRVERNRKHLEHQKKAEEREKKQEEPKAIEAKPIERKETTDAKSKDRERRKREKKHKSTGMELVLFGQNRDRQEKEKKERKEKREGKEKKEEKEKEKEKKHKHHSSDKRRKGSTSSTSNSPKEEDLSTALVVAAPPTPPPEDDLKVNELALADKALAPSLTQTISNLPIDGATARVLGMAPQILAMIDPDGDSPLSALLLQLTNILDTLDCLNASYAALMATLGQDPEALATVGLLFAQISAIVAKTAPSVIIAAKTAFPFIFSLLATPQFLITAGAGVIIFGGYKIIRTITGGGSTPQTPEKDDDEEHLAYGSCGEDSDEEEAPTNKPQGTDGPKRALTLPALPSSSITATAIASPKRALTLPPSSPSSREGTATISISVDVARAQRLPPTPPETPSPEAQEKNEKEKESKRGKRQILKRYFTTAN